MKAGMGLQLCDVYSYLLWTSWKKPSKGLSVRNECSCIYNWAMTYVQGDLVHESVITALQRFGVRWLGSEKGVTLVIYWVIGAGLAIITCWWIKVITCAFSYCSVKRSHWPLTMKSSKCSMSYNRWVRSESVGGSDMLNKPTIRVQHSLAIYSSGCVEGILSQLASLLCLCSRFR